MEKAKVAVFIGSASDEATVAPCADILKKLGIPFRFTVTSAHRTPNVPPNSWIRWKPRAVRCSSAPRAWPPISPARLPPAP